MVALLHNNIGDGRLIIWLKLCTCLPGNKVHELIEPYIRHNDYEGELMGL